MPTVKYEVIVSVGSSAPNEQVPIAQAASYLSYADQTDTIGYHANVYNVSVFGGGSEDWGVGLYVEFPVANPEDIERFENEMDNLARVKTIERVV